MSTVIRTALVVASLAALTACGSGSAQSASAPQDATSTGTASASPTPTGPPTPEYAELGKRALKEALLGVQDLPPGYSQDPPSKSGPDKTFCDYKPPVTEKVKVSHDYTKGGGLSTEVLRIGLREYESPEKAQAAFDAMAKTLDTCHSETYQGSKMKYAVMSAPKVGDASIGVRITADNMTLLQDYAIAGPTMISVGGGGLMNADADQVANLLQQQVQAYEDAATQ